MTYLPYTTLLEGDQPLVTNSPLSITSPSNVPVGPSLSITPVISLLSAPAGADPTVALSFITLNPATLIFTGPNQALTTTIQANVPLGNVAGTYAYQIATPGWPAGAVDNFAVINMNVTVPQNRQPPSVQLNSPTDGSSYVYTVGGPAVSIPLQFQATAAAATPITGVDADASGAPIPVTITGLNSGNVSATGTILLSAPGIYAIQARATNSAGTSATAVSITVTIAGPAPKVTIAQPTASGSYTYVIGGPPLGVPFSIAATSAYGGVNALAATLNGNPVTVTTSGLGTLNATGTGTLQLSAAGQYTLSATATDALGATTTSVQFTVNAQYPPPSVTITQPTNGAVFTYVAGNPPLSIPFAFTAQAATGATISSLNASLNGTAVTVTSTGVGTTSAAGSGTLQVSAAGTYTFTAGAAGGGASGSSKLTFTVNVTQPPPPPYNLVWLPPLSLGKVQEGGSKVPIKFQVQSSSIAGHKKNKDDDRNDRDDRDDDDDDTVKDTSVTIAISEVLANGSYSPAQIFSYGKKPNPPTYAIEDDDTYHLNFPTTRGVHRYHIEVYNFPSGSTTPQLLGTKEFTTR
ncbi:MAG TPA: hypothetical protein VMC06_01730 [Opitutaceae bacterium]|nr:hypothetical protein [Opitutaceae bacterium]